MGIIIDSSKVLTGITAQRVISLIMIPFVARALGPQDYGIYNIALSLCALGAVIGGLALESSIAVSSSQEQAIIRTSIVCVAGIVFSAFFWGLTFISLPFLNRFYSKEVILALCYMVPFYIALNVINTALQNYIGYQGRFNIFPLADISSTIINYATLFVVYFLWWPDYRALIMGGVLALLGRMALYLYAAPQRMAILQHALRRRTYTELGTIKEFCAYNLPSNLLNSASVQLPSTLLAFTFSEAVVGYFSMARSIITIPVNLSGQALGQVFYPRAAQEYRQHGTLDRITWQTFIFSCQLTIYPAVFTAVVGGFIFPLLLGSTWAGIGPYIILLLPMILLNAVQTQIGIGFIFNILHQQYKVLIGNIILFFVRIIPLAIALIWISSPHMTIGIYSLASAIGYAILLIWIFVAVSVPVIKAFMSWLGYCLISALCTMPLLLVYLTPNLPVFFLCMTLSLLLYGGIAWTRFLTPTHRALLLVKMNSLRIKSGH